MCQLILRSRVLFLTGEFAQFIVLFAFVRNKLCYEFLFSSVLQHLRPKSSHIDPDAVCHDGKTTR